MFRKIALSAAALSAVAVGSFAGASSAEAGFHYRPHHRPAHVFHRPHFVPHVYVAPRPHFVTYGCHYTKRQVHTHYGYVWKTVKVCPGHGW